jgi:hypothetical protein
MHLQRQKARTKRVQGQLLRRTESVIELRCQNTTKEANKYAKCMMHDELVCLGRVQPHNVYHVKHIRYGRRRQRCDISVSRHQS